MRPCDILMTRVRQELLSAKYRQLKPKGFCRCKQYLDRAPRKGASGLVLFHLPLGGGLRERPWFGALFSFDSGCQHEFILVSST
jgi:hypothetical protein